MITGLLSGATKGVEGGLGLAERSNVDRFAKQKAVDAVPAGLARFLASTLDPARLAAAATPNLRKSLLFTVGLLALGWDFFYFLCEPRV